MHALRVLLLLAVPLAPPAHAAEPPPAPSFTEIEDVMGTTLGTGVTGVSGDGGTAVGFVLLPFLSSDGLIWTSAAGIERVIPAFDDNFGGSALAASQDGSTVVGGDGQDALLWTAVSGVVPLGSLPGSTGGGRATGVSGDGAFVVGWAENANGDTEAFRWTNAGGMVGLGDLAGGDFSSLASAVSDDGSVVVGSGTDADGVRPVVWTATTGMEVLGDLPGGTAEGIANAVSADGSVIVGGSDTASGIQAFRWTEQAGMVGLGHLDTTPHPSEALSVTADGSVVVGVAEVAAGDVAFVWDARHGMRALESVLVAGGATPTTPLSTATGVSDDATVYVGTTTDSIGSPEKGWIAAIPVPEPAIAWLQPIAVGVVLALRGRWRARRGGGPHPGRVPADCGDRSKASA